ncbi:MAG TPA: HAMP domain-containing sensor histidine kinase [Spirochaetia bacterium]|nr:HAMP domain-containing sensor histidine kinase [Spirochaetia bacterium]HTZ50230.1 HAMP domain-containing sensor histidine kinase [Spirochaetia bacterium]
MRLFSSFYARLSTIFLLLILALGAGCVVIAFRASQRLFDDVEQLLNRGYARSIAQELSPLVANGFSEEAVKSAIHYMMVLNPMVEIYLLDDSGRILAYFLNPAERIVRTSVQIGPVQQFVQSGGRLALGEDPRSATRERPFSAAALSMGARQGYVYVILGGEKYDASLRMIRDSYYLRAGIVAFFLALAATLIVGLVLFSLLTRRLSSLSEAVRGFERGDLGRRVAEGGSDELGALGRAFNDMAATIEADVEKIRSAERMRRDLIGNISHDLRSPITSIQGYLETLALKDAELTPEERRSFLQVSLRSTANLKRLVEELFELAKLDAGQVQLRVEPLQVAELAQDVALKLAPEARSSQVQLAVEPQGDLPLVTGDVGMLERVITNLMENALHFTPAGGRVKAVLRGSPSEVRVTVEDTGSGISAEDLPHVFERFYRADSSRTPGARNGAGLGLAIARQIVELHGSSLEVESRPGEGARFSFTLTARS